jgi:hypothetical protein
MNLLKPTKKEFLEDFNSLNLKTVAISGDIIFLINKSSEITSQMTLDNTKKMLKINIFNNASFNNGFKNRINKPNIYNIDVENIITNCKNIEEVFNYIFYNSLHKTIDISALYFENNKDITFKIIKNKLKDF